MTDIEILESTYYDTCDIYRLVKEKDPNTGITSTTKKLIHSKLKCALSNNNRMEAMVVDGIGKLVNVYELFTRPIDIKEGDIVEVSQMGEISIYLASKPFRYSSHYQTMLEAKERV